MKIWVIGRNYPTEKNKMCGSFEFEQAQMLARQGHQICYITCPFHPLYKVKKWGPVDWQEDNIHIYAYSQLYFPQRFNIYWDSFKRYIWEKLLERVKKEQGIPDVIHLHYPTLISVPNSILAFKKKGTKIITTEHWSNVLTGKATTHEKQQLKTYVEGVDHFICVGGPLKESVLKITGTNKIIEVIPNIVPDIFKAREKDHIPVKFVSVGRLIKSKQFDMLISAFSEAFSKDDDVLLTIIGGGPQYSRLEKQIRNLGMESKIKMVGSQPRSVVAEIMSKSDVLVSYSRLETFGVPVIEGWYSGMPAIATTAIGFAEYWKDFLGVLIPFDDEKTLEETLRKVKMKIDEEYYPYQKIRQYAQDNFSEQAVYQKLIKLYIE